MRWLAWSVGLLLLGGCLLPPPGAAPGGSGGWMSAARVPEPPDDPGKTRLTLPNGSRYEGDMKGGVPHGRGLLIWPDGARYEGAFREGERTGRGVFTWPSGNRYEGLFRDGQRHGEGVFTWANGAQYTGVYQMGSKHGPGIFQFADKKVEVCYLEPERQSQLWDNGRLTVVGAAPRDEPPPDLNRERRTNPPLISAPPATPAWTPPAATAKPWQQPVSTTPRLSRRLTAPPQTGPEPPPPAPIQTEAVPTARPIPAVRRAATAAAPAQPPWPDPHSGMTFAAIPGGCFAMGSEQGLDNEKPVHETCLGPYWLGTREVTQAQWRRVMGALPPQAVEQPDLPVENVSWHAVQAFIDTLNRKGRTRYRLPSEAEWEYACRDGGAVREHCGDGPLQEIAWFKGNSDNQAHPVGELRPNRLGLYDMSGNVWEWTADWYDADFYRGASSRDPAGPASGTAKVFRGGAWLSEPPFLRSTLRYDLVPDRGYHLLGFRLAASRS